MRPLGRENHRHSRRTCDGCGRSYVGVTFEGVKLVNGKLCVDCETAKRVQESIDKIKGVSDGKQV